MTPTALWLVILYILASLLALLSLFVASHRSRRLLWPTLLNCVAATAVLILAVGSPSALSRLSPFGPGRYELFIIVLLALVFVSLVEIPGFIINFLYDRKKEDALQKISDTLLDVRFSPTDGNRTRLRDSITQGRHILDETHLGDFLAKCAEELVLLGNADPQLVIMMADQVRGEQLKVSGQSKHPFPALVEVLSLSGVAFVLAEILAVLRAK